MALILAQHPDVNPRFLELEILETSTVKNFDMVSVTMTACYEHGLSFSLDDFGTGYSSLTHLKCLPAKVIKIDRSFVRDMLEDDDDLAIIEGIISLAKSFQRTVIAEGVETIAHGQALMEMGCDLGQGYAFARPMPAGIIPSWINTWKANNS